MNAPYVHLTQLAQSQLVADTAHGILIDLLTRYGNEISLAHSDVLARLLKDFADLAFGIKRGRFAYPLNCGLGKTQSIVAFAAALHRLEIPLSIAVSASKVEALCELKRHLLSAGIPDERIGLTHSYDVDEARVGSGEPFASLPSTTHNETRQIHLVTHSRIRGNAPVARYFEFHGRPRDLLVWDESLLVSEARGLDVLALRRALGWLLTPSLDIKTETDLYLKVALDCILADLKRQEEGEEPRPIQLRQLDDAAIGRFKRQLGHDDAVEPLRRLLEMSQQPLRAVSTAQGNGLVTYDIVVPRELESIAILDASYPIRALERMDRTIKLGFHVPPDLKRHDHVTIYHAVVPSGRTSVSRDFADEKRICAEVCEVVKTIPQEEAVIIWMFKQRDTKRQRRQADDVNYRRIMEAELRAAGIDTTARMTVPTSGGRTVERDRIVFRTWGQETSDSQFSYASNMIFAGVLHRSHYDLASCLVAQKDDLMHRVDHEQLRILMQSEVAHSVYQALCRGSCRVIVGNQARPMKAWLIHRDRSIRATLVEVMPGVQWATWETKYLRVNARSELVDAIGTGLDAVPSTTQRLSVSSLKKALGLKPTEGRSTFGRALDEYLFDCATWEKDGRSLVRIEWDWGEEEAAGASVTSQQPPGEEIKTHVPYSY